MAQATFLWPYIANLPRDTYKYSTEATAAFADLTFRYGGLATLKQGPSLFAGGSYSNTTIQFTHDDMIAAGNQDINEIVFRMVANPGGLTNYARWILRIDSAWTNQSHLPNNCIFAQLTGDNDIEIRRVTSSSASALIAEKTDLPDFADGWPLLCRFRAEGTAIKLKVWSEADPEPASWDIETTDGTMNATGIPYCTRWNGTGQGEFSHMTFGAGESAPSLMGSISGTVYISPDTEVARTVRAVAREDPMKVFETVSGGDGSYNLQVLLGYTYSVFALEDTYNGAIKDRITPVNPDA